MKIFIFLLAALSTLMVLDSSPVPSPVADPEPCLEIILRVLQLFLTTTSRPRRREYTTPEEDEPESTTEPITEHSSTESRPTEGNDSGESADEPSVNESGNPNADSPSTTERNSDDTPNEVIPKNVDTIRRLRKSNKKNKKNKNQNDWWFGNIKF